MKPTLKNSDVVVEYINDEAIRDYRATVVMANTGIYIQGEHELDQWKATVSRFQAEGMRTFSWVYFVPHALETFELFAHDVRLQSAACRDPFGNPLVVPHLADYRQNGVPLYRLCQNHPAFREYLRERIYLSIASGVEGLAFDEWPSSAWSHRAGGCFCPYCMDGFRNYLQRRFTTAELAARGIADSARFDYRRVVKYYGNSPQSYLSSLRVGEVPLVREFLDFQFETVAQLVSSLKNYASALLGRPCPLGVNNVRVIFEEAACAPLLNDVETFALEVELMCDTPDVSPRLLRDYKIATSLDKVVSADPLPLQWAYVRQHGFTALVRHWVAFTYACGHIFRAPVKVWARLADKSPAEQSNWYFAPVKEIAPVFHFVRDHAAALDGFRDYRPVTVLVVDTQDKEEMGKVSLVGQVLLNHHVPFGLTVCDPRREDPARAASQLGESRVVVTFGAPGSRPEAGLNLPLGCVRLHEPGPAELGALGSFGASVSSAAVWIFPRVKDGALALHLVNRQLDVRANAVVPVEGLTVEIDCRVFGLSPEARVSYASLEPEFAPHDVASGGETLKVQVGRLGTWGIVRVGADRESSA